MEATPTTAATQLLEGVLVVDFTRYLPGPFCTLQLAWLGAEVHTVERPPAGDPMRGIPPLGRDGESLAAASLQRGKQQHLVDLSTGEGREAAVALCARADVVVEGFRPGGAARLGIDVQALRRVNPALVYCSITGYGQDGPWAQLAGHDANYEAVSGLLDMNGTTAGPQLPAVPLADLAGGSLAATAICAALVRRAASGEGAYIDLSLAEAALALQAHALPGAAVDEVEGTRGGGMLSGGMASYGIYRCSDGGHVAVGPIEPHFFRRLVELLDLPEGLVDRQYDPSAQDELRAALSGAFASRTAPEWELALEAEDACVTRLRHPREVASHPQLRARGAVDRLEGGAPAPAAPWVIDGRRPVAGQRTSPTTASDSGQA